MRLVIRSFAGARDSEADLHRVEYSVKSALMAPRSFSFPVRANAPVVLAIAALTCLPEIILTLYGTLSPAGAAQWRMTLLAYGAFWNGLLADWTPLYRFQPTTMFLTHALLHGGLLHLLGNMVAVVALGGIVVARIGQQGFVLLYVVSALGGALGFSMLSGTEAPMVGASGAVFGLIGAWKFWEWQLRHHFGSPMRPLWMSLLGLAVLNAVLWVLLSGLLAWEAHLGGFAAGVLFAAIVTPSLRHRV